MLRAVTTSPDVLSEELVGAWDIIDVGLRALIVNKHVYVVEHTPVHLNDKVNIGADKLTCPAYDIMCIKDTMTHWNERSAY